jgi:exodeoxyribonuclease VII small subunit
LSPVPGRFIDVPFYMPKQTESPPEHTFESALTRLEGLVAEMEGDRMPLDQLIVAYEEGTKLVKICQQKLAEAEKKIEIIQRRSGGEPELREFEPGKSAPPSSATPSDAKDISLF